MRSKILTLSSIVVAFVLALTCGLVLTLGSTPNTDANAAASHTDHTDWTDLNSYGSAELASGNYYLSADLNKDFAIKAYANVTICLNGYKLSNSTGQPTSITVNSGQHLTLEDCNTTTEHQYYVGSNGQWVFDDGTGAWDTAYAQAGAEKQGIVNGGVFNGGITIKAGTLTINGGTISGSTNSGVTIEGSSTFIMNDGAISGNTAATSGSAIYAATAQFVDSQINSGKIDGDIAVDSATSHTLRVVGGRFATANVADNIVATTSEGSNCIAVFQGYEVVEDNSDEQYPYVVLPKELPPTVSHEGTDGWYNLSEWIFDFGTFLPEGKYLVDQDISIAGALTMDGNVTLCLNGHKLANDGSDSVIIISEGASFTLQDCNTTGLSHNYYVDSTGLWVFDNGQDGWQTAYDSADVKGTVQGGVLTGGNTTEGGGGVRLLSDSTFTMSGGTISGNTASDGSFRFGGGVLVYMNSTFNMNGGALSGNTAKTGGGLHAYFSSTTNITAGTISDNTATENGGGIIFESYYDYTTSVMNISGGTISGNTATQNGGGIYSSGGGILTMSGGEISNNNASNGAGVYNDFGTFNLDGGTISDNTATTNGGGVYNKSIFVMTEGAISGNTATTSASAIYIEGQKYDAQTIDGGKIDGTIVDVNSALKIRGGRFTLANDDTDKVGTDTVGGNNGVLVFKGYEVVLDDTDAEYPYLVQRLAPPATVSHEGTDGWYKLSEWIPKMGLVLTDGKYLVDQASITLTDTLSIEGVVTLCLDGNKLVGNGSTSVVTVQSGYTFTLQDCNSTTQSHQYYVDSAGLWVFNNGQEGWDAAYAAAGAEKQGTVSGGVLTGGKVSTGGGVYVNDNAALILESGTISGNSSTEDFYGGGGAVAVMSDATFTMNGGAISGNTAQDCGGGVYVRSGNFTMNGGKVENNTASGQGNGVYASGPFTMNDGFMGDAIYRFGDNQINIIAGYFKEGDTKANTVQGYDLGNSTVTEVEEGTPEYLAGYLYRVDFVIELSVETIGNSQYDGSAVANMEDFSLLATIGTGTSPDHDYVFQYAPQGTEDFVDGLPSENGKYTIKASLTYFGKTAEYTFDFEITKRALTVNGLEAIDRLYDGTIDVQLVGTLVGAIEGDDVQLVVSGTIESADVGTDKLVTFLGSLTGADMDNYTLTQPVDDIFVNITPRQLEVNWSATQFTYNEKLQQPTATVDTGVAGETVTLVVTAEDSINVGTYTATAAMATANGNYVLSGETITYSIAAKKVSVTWGETEFVYDGKAHTPTFTILDENGNTLEVTNVTVTGGQTEIGTYTASVYINDNYIVDNASITFTITQQPINTVATWGIIGGVTGVCLLTVGAIFLIVKRKKV